MILFSAVCVLGLAVAFVQAAPSQDEDKRNEEASTVAKAWFESWMKGQTDVTTSLSAIPFAFDKKQEVKSFPELKKLYEQVVAKKGKRDLNPTSVKIKSSSPENVVVILMIEDEGIAVSVRPGEHFRVVGFRD